MNNDQIVIVDDEHEIIKSYEIFLRKSGYTNFRLFTSPVEFMAAAGELDPAVVFLDLSMPHMNGEDLLNELRDRFRNTSFFIISGREDVQTAVRCIKKGALDYIVKPIDKDRFRTAVIKGLEIYSIRAELFIIKEKLNECGGSPAFSSIITRSPVMERMLKYIEAVSIGDAPVLITGETGTGKELFAEAVHKSSGRKGEFIPVNVSALDENMFNDTLFGHVKGAFTGADKERTGLLASAMDGTVFLDEIGDLSESSQVKLLRVLQNSEFMPIGSDKTKKTTARIVAATNADLKQKVAAGTFRQDLFYRLSAHSVTIPPLRERQEDIEVLFQFFYEKQLDALGLEPDKQPVELVGMLKGHSFPGNVRELEAVVTDYVMLYRNTHVTKSELKDFLGSHNIEYSAKVPLADGSNFVYQGDFPTFKEMEGVLIEEAMKRSGGIQSKAASLLGISRQALNKRLSGN